MTSVQTTSNMESVCGKSLLKSFLMPLDVTMVQRGPTYVMSTKEGVTRIIGAEPIIPALGRPS